MQVLQVLQKAQLQTYKMVVMAAALLEKMAIDDIFLELPMLLDMAEKALQVMAVVLAVLLVDMLLVVLVVHYKVVLVQLLVIMVSLLAAAEAVVMAAEAALVAEVLVAADVVI